MLLVAGKRARGFWLPPGGHVEFQEHATAAAVREVFEETGVRVRVARLIAWREVWWDEEHTMELYFAGELLADGEGAREADHGWEWVEVAKLGERAVVPEELGVLCGIAVGEGEEVAQLAAADFRGREGAQ